MTQTTIILLITLFMIVLFLSGKFSYGLVTMTCCTLLCLTGVYDLKTAFSGLNNQLVILIASMFVISSALSKTGLMIHLKSTLSLLNGKKNMVLVGTMFLVTILMVQFMPGPVTISLMVTFISVLKEDGEVTPSKILLPLLMVTAAWECVLPIGIGATVYLQDNALISGIISSDDYLYRLFDFVKIGLLPGAVVTIYCLFVWKKMPSYPIQTASEALVSKGSLKKWQEILVYALFCIILVCLALNSLIGSYMYLVPVLAVLILAYTKILPLKEIVANLTTPTVWMIAGITVISQAIGDSGAGNIIGNSILNLLGNTTNQWFVTAVVAVVAVLMTTFMSNTGTYLVLMPIAASVATAANMDPRAVCACVGYGSLLAFAFPTGSTTCALAYALGNYNPIQSLKYTLPALVMGTVALIISVNLWFPA